MKNCLGSLVVAPCLFVSLLLGGCAGSSSNSPTTTTPTTPQATAPTISAISPAAVPAGAAATTLAVTGTGFTTATVVQVNGTAETTTYVSATQVTAVIPAGQLATGAFVQVAALNGTAASTTVNLEVDNPSPTIAQFSPTSVVIGSGPTTVTVTGTGFLPSTVIQLGMARTTTYVSATIVNVALIAADFAVATPLALTAVNPSPGGGSSTSASLPVTNPVASVTQLAPATILAGSAATTVTLTGSGFLSSTVLRVNGAARSTTYVSATQLTASLSATDLATAATLAITAFTPTPGGGNSNALNLTVANPAPTVAQVAPASIPAGFAASTVTLTGTGFIPASAVQVNGSPRTTTFVSATQLTAALTATDLATAGTLSLSVTNASPGGGSSAAVSLSVTNPVPAITQLSPATLIAGSAASTISVTGTGFVPSTVINVAGASRVTTYISATQLNTTLTVADLAAPGSISLTAVNAAPGGGTSAAASVAVNIGTPTITSFAPTSLITGTTTPTTVAVNGTNFVAASYILVNSQARATTFISSTGLSFAATVADQAAATTLRIAVVNSAPGGNSTTASLPVAGPTPTPVISTVSPTSFTVGSSSPLISIYGSGITTASTIQWNGTILPGTNSFFYQGSSIIAITNSVSSSLLASTGTASITVITPTAIPSVSNALTISIMNPPVPTLTSISPAGGPLNTASAETLTGTGFNASSTVALNGQVIPSTFVSSTQLTANFPASALAMPGNQSVTVTTPAPGGGTSKPQFYSTFISIANNDLVYNPTDGLLYASVPVSSAGGIGNCIVGIDPYTGVITRQIQVGTNPNKLALSTDGTQLFVGLDGASAVAQINLSQGTVVNQFSLGGGPGVYNAPYTAAYLAAVPGLSNSVAVATTGQYGNGSNVTIFDSGIARTGSAIKAGEGPLSFGSSASTLYVDASYIDTLTIGPTGITSLNQLASPSGTLINLQYDNGALYLSNGQVLNAANGTLNGTFYTASNSQASGPVVSDSTLGRAFIAVNSFSSTAAVYVFDEASFNVLGSIPINALGTQGYPTSLRKIVRWGQDGIALAAVPSAFTTKNQIYIFQSPLVKDVSSSPSDLSVTLSVPTTAATGTAFSYVASVANAGPNAAVGTTFSESLDPSLIINSITASQGSCSTAVPVLCDLGGLANGATATVTVNVTPPNSGTLAATASLSSSSFDPVTTNNQATATTTVTGALYGAVPSVSSISPGLVQAGTAAFTLTVKGNGFNPGSVVTVGNTALVTTYVSSTQLTATATAATIASYGWAPVSVSNPSPGGGVSSAVPLTIYNLINVPATSILFDPYGQSLYATIPGSATGITGNSVVAVNPFTGTLGTPIAVGSQPNLMAETADGDLLYIGLSGSDSLAQFNLATQSVAATIPVKYQSTNTPALSLATVPGSDTTLAIGFSSFATQFGIFDVTGTTGSFRSNISGIYSGNNPVAVSPTQLYAYDSQTSGAEFYRYGINANGLTLIDGTTLNGLGGFVGGFQSQAGLVYGQGGGIANPATTPPTQVQTLSLIDFAGSGVPGQSVGLAADPSLRKEFLLLSNLAGSSAFALVRYDLNSYLPEAVLPLPSSLQPSGNTSPLLRFGQDGLALLTSNSIGVTSPVVQLLLLKSPFVTPQELSTNTAATITSSSATTITHGSSNTLLTLTGSNFIPGVAVTWNGSYRTTTITDATHVTVAIPASDLTTVGTASLVATNPGAPASSTLTLTVN